MGGEGGKGKGQVDDQPHPDSNFYDNLPFQGLKNPPKKVKLSIWDEKKNVRVLVTKYFTIRLQKQLICSLRGST